MVVSSLIFSSYDTSLHFIQWKCFELCTWLYFWMITYLGSFCHQSILSKFNIGLNQNHKAITIICMTFKKIHTIFTIYFFPLDLFFQKKIIYHKFKYNSRVWSMPINIIHITSANYVPLLGNLSYHCTLNQTMLRIVNLQNLSVTCKPSSL